MRRVRFAPSPTGPLHMGGVRTALYNYLYAKQSGGKFILRIEDTDSQRFVPGAEEYIIEALKWCGISPDEGVDLNGKIVETPSAEHPFAPYRQSQRAHLYRKYAEELVEKGDAYYAFDTSEELDAIRKEAESRGEAFIYNHTTREKLKNSLTLPEEESKRLIAGTNNWVIRFKMPLDRDVKMNDLIRGEIVVNTNTLDDKVLWKVADNLPTYHLANIVDDHLMEITEVIRGEEWLPSLPLHYLLYEAFGWQDSQPQFAHLSLLLKPDGKGKLSKRDGDRLGFPVFPLEWKSPTGEISRGYREDGYYPQAFINMLALLGWNPGGEEEIFTLEELTRLFSLERVVKSGAKFNPEKARWFNQEYLRMQSSESLAQYLLPILKDHGVETTKEYAAKVCELFKERAYFVKDLWELADFMFVAPTEYDQTAVAKFMTPETRQQLPQVMEFILNYEPFEAKPLEEALHNFIKSNEFPMGKIMNSLRLALVGASKGPGVADIMALLGKEETKRRFEKITRI